MAASAVSLLGVTCHAPVLLAPLSGACVLCFQVNVNYYSENGEHPVDHAGIFLTGIGKCKP